MCYTNYPSKYSSMSNLINTFDDLFRHTYIFIKTDTLQLFAKHRIAGRLYNIPLMYVLVLWNSFLIKKKKKCLEINLLTKGTL